MARLVTHSALWKRLLLFSFDINARFTTNISKLYAKKRFQVKNSFTFQNEFKKQFDLESFPTGRIVSSELHLNQDSSPKKSSHTKQRKTKQKTLPSLTYRGEILFGIHPVYLALLLNKRTLYNLFIRKDTDSGTEDGSARKEEIFHLAKSLKIPISFIDSYGLKILAPGAVHQGVCLDAGFLPLSSWNGDEDESEYKTSEELPLWLVLDEILDPMNVGAIIRSAYYFGVNKVFTVKGNSCKLSPTVSKASSGALEVINLYQLESLEDFIKERKDNNWSIVSTLAYSENKTEHSQHPISASNFTISKPTILILGNEGRGISERVKTLCDTFISIEPRQSLHQGVDSLNVSVATGILLYVLNSKNFRS